LGWDTKMSKEFLTKQIIKIEITGFSLVIFVLWIDEIFDLPFHLFGAQKTPVNLVESSFETVFVILLSILIVLLTFRIIKHVKYLEGFLVCCAFCRKIRIDENWIPIEEYIRDHSEADFSHGLCAECKEKHYGDLFRKEGRSD
jgi:hypothetical protein